MTAVLDLDAPPNLERLLELRTALEATTDRDEAAGLVELIESEYAWHDPFLWLKRTFPSYVRYEFGPHHGAFWRWVWSLRPGVLSRPFVGIWSRGGAKSTSAEAAVVAVGRRRARSYVLYVGAKQDRADDHVGNIGGMLESPLLAEEDPELCERRVGKYGSSKGWRRNRLHTTSGLIVDAIGLDSAARGAKVDEQRPDLIVIDDVDDPHDSPGVVRKKLAILERSMLLAGTPDLAVIAIQNLIHPDGVFAQLVDRRTEMLSNRILSGPVPALLGPFAIEGVDLDPEDADDEGARSWRIVGNPTPTWDGQDIDKCEQLLAIVGPRAFRIECQHQTELATEGMFSDVLEQIRHCTRADVPDLVRKSIAVDPATTDTDQSDSHGCQLDGIDAKGVIYRLRSWEKRAAPSVALEHAISWGYEEGVIRIQVEATGTDLTGRNVEQSWRVAFGNALENVLKAHPEWARKPRRRMVIVKPQSSLGSKADRASRMHTDYERVAADGLTSRIVHVVGWGTGDDHLVLERAMGRFPDVKPFDLVDASYWTWRDLRRRRKIRGLSPAELEQKELASIGALGRPGGVLERDPLADLLVRDHGEWGG